MLDSGEWGNALLDCKPIPNNGENYSSSVLGIVKKASCWRDRLAHLVLYSLKWSQGVKWA